MSKVTPPSHALRVPVLMYHRIDLELRASEHAYGVRSTLFDAQMGWLAVNGYQPCRIDDFGAWLRGEAQLPQKSVLITFDDGFKGLYDYALPTLSARGWPATVFLVSSLIGQFDSWSPSRVHRARRSRDLLGLHEIDVMKRHGIEFQSHSRSHLDLTTLDNAALHDQIDGSRRELEDLLGSRVDHFAYPFGRFDPRVRDVAVDAGYKLAFSVEPGFNRPGIDPMAVRRLDITGIDARARFGRKVAMGTNDGSVGASLTYFGRQIAARLARRP